METKFKTAVKLLIITSILAAITSIGGLLWKGLYKDSQAIHAVWFDNDIIALFIAVSLLLVSVNFSLKGSKGFSWCGSVDCDICCITIEYLGNGISMGRGC